MSNRRTFLVSMAAAGGVALLSAPSFGQGIVAQQATALTRVYGDGLRFVAIAVAYRNAVQTEIIKAEDFSVVGRKITDVFPATSTNPADRAAEGMFVIVELSPDDDAATLNVEAPRNDKIVGGGANAKGGPGKAGEPSTADVSWRTPKATIVQKAISVTVGNSIPAAQVSCTKVHNLIVDDFQMLEYADPKTGKSLRYNLYVPRDYDPAKSYPLVNFMHDAGATSQDPRTTLRQGLGAISWASPEDQAKRPCFVLAPQYAEIIADDDSQTSSMLDTTIDLIKSLLKTYSIDETRLYTTGQSGGGMMSIAMNIRYPEFFAASFLVACQWDASLVAPMAGNRLFILVSQDDEKAFPGQNAITEALEAHGARVARAVWNGTWTGDQFRFAYDQLNAEHAQINYVSFAAGTVIPEGESSAGASGHRNTWRIAYAIEPVREWLLRERA